ncbi:hypothetical protein COCCADRAFT_97214, partial [Bipolaris zeicola 26-R-13]
VNAHLHNQHSHSSATTRTDSYGGSFKYLVVSPDSQTSVPQTHWCCWHRSLSWLLQVLRVTANPAIVRKDQEQH